MAATSEVGSLMQNLPKWVLPLVAFAVLLDIAVTRPDFSVAPAPAYQITQRSDGNTNIAWGQGADGTSANAEAHWEKHGREFPEDHNAAEYETEASNFVHHPPPGAEFKHRPNGDTQIYDPATNTFAVEDRHGRPRTMFRPDRGRAYWDRQ